MTPECEALTRAGSHTRFVTTGAVVLLLALGLGWVVYANRSKPLLVIGDSLAMDAKADLTALGEAAGYDPTVDAIPGSELGQRLPEVQQQTGRRSGPLVIELGTNDVILGGAANEVDGYVDEAVGFVAGVPCVVFVDVGLLTDKGDIATAVNSHLLQTAAQHRNMHVYDWAGVLAQHPDWSADGIHVRKEFVRLYAQGIIDTVKANC
jgi:hypothetical protein